MKAGGSKSWEDLEEELLNGQKLQGLSHTLTRRVRECESVRVCERERVRA